MPPHGKAPPVVTDQLLAVAATTYPSSSSYSLPPYLLTCVLSPSTLVVADACGGRSMTTGNMLVSFLAGSTSVHGQATWATYPCFLRLSLLSKASYNKNSLRVRQSSRVIRNPQSPPSATNFAISNATRVSQILSQMSNKLGQREREE